MIYAQKAMRYVIKASFDVVKQMAGVGRDAGKGLNPAICS